MKYKIDLNMSSSRFDTEVEASSPAQLEERVKDIVRNKISEVWTVYARDAKEKHGEFLHEFLVVRTYDRFYIEPEIGMMDVARYKE